MRIGIAATPAIAIPALERLSEKHAIEFLLTQPDKPFGRGQSLRESDVAQWAHSKAIPVFKELSEEVPLSSVDLVVVIAYGKIISQKFLEVPRFGFINLHYSLLPRWRGAAPVQRSLMAGDKSSGVTVFRLDQGMDTGPIFTVRQTPIDDGWSASELFERLNSLGSDALLEALSKIESGEEPHAQKGEPTYAPKIAKEEYQIQFSDDARKVRDQIRGLYPNAFFTYGGQRIKVTKAHDIEGVSAEPGAMCSLDPFTIACAGQSALVIDRIIPEGKREMSSAEWIRGARIEIGEIGG